MNKKGYVSRILRLYLALPQTPSRLNRLDYQLAGELYEKGFAEKDIETAMLLATARRMARNTNAPPLGPIRSLHYFLPVLNEITKNPMPEDYIQYLRTRIRDCLKNPAG